MDAEEVGAALIAVGGVFAFVLVAGLLLFAGLEPTPANLFVLVASAVAGVGSLAGYLATTDRIGGVHAGHARSGATYCLFAAMPVANRPPAEDWYFRELFVIGGGLLFLGGLLVLAAAFSGRNDDAAG